MAFEFRLPDIGEGVHEGEIVQWLVKAGDTIAEDQPLVEIMTDKVTAEIPSPVSGLLQEIRGNVGDVIQVGSVIAVFGDQAATPAKSATETAAPVATGPQAVPNAPVNGNAQHTTNAKVLAAPATRKLARELGVELSDVSGTGPHGRVLQSDVRAFESGEVEAPKPLSSAEERLRAPVQTSVPVGKTTSAIAFKAGEDQRVPFGGLRRKIAEHLVKSKQTAPHFAYVEEVEMTNLIAFRAALMKPAEAAGVKLSYLPFFIKAVIAGLKTFPMLNAQLDDAAQQIVYKGSFHIGIAVATDQGLIVPVIKHADQKSVLTLATEVATLAAKARAGKLALDELKGGTFTLTSIGSIGGLFGIPIINHPEVGILGINKIERRAVVRVIDGVEQIVIRDMMHLSISCDHRVVDGAEAARFVKEVAGYLENPARLLLNEGV